VVTSRKKFIPNSLKKYRRIMGFSQEDVRRELKLSSTSIISKWERGLVMPSADNLLKLSVLYKTLANELYYELGKEIQHELFPHEFSHKKNQTKKPNKNFDLGP
jgi:transcriptional regulator with XRE-family HTH domain